MNASHEVVLLLRDIINRQAGRTSLARWLAERSLRFLESPNMLDRMVVADLDAALGEVQRGVYEEDHLLETAKQLVEGLGLDLSAWEIIIDTPQSSVVIMTASSNSGGTAMAAVAMEVVPSAA